MIRYLLLAPLTAAAIYLAIALALVVSQSPATPEPGESGGLAFSRLATEGHEGLPQPETYRARDGASLPYRRYAAAGEPGRILILLHGSGWHGMQFNRMARELAARGAADVIVPDLRGHGAAPARRGDVDHIGQYEEDIADLIGILREEQPGAEIVLGGHSSGGGLVVRYAGGEREAAVDRFLLMAPFLKHDAPTTRPNSGGWAHSAVRRIIGLTKLNAVGVTALNHLPVIAFAMPRAVLDGPLGGTATTRYSYRLNTGYAPRSDYEADIARLDRPFLLVAGSADEAFRADAYEPLMRELTPHGTYRVLDGVGHLDVVERPEVIDLVEAWLTGGMEADPGD